MKTSISNLIATIVSILAFSSAYALELPTNTIRQLVDNEVVKIWQLVQEAKDAQNTSIQPVDKVQLNKVNVLGNLVQGQEAIETVAPELLEQAAEKANFSVEVLKEELLNDSTLYIDKYTGILVFLDKTYEPASTDATENGFELPATVPPGTDIHKLHSKPSATIKIYLNFFKGMTPADRVWGGVSSVPYHSGVSNEVEDANVYHIWSSVAEDYAPFNVDVTTEEPSFEDATRTDIYDKNFMQTVNITKSYSEQIVGRNVGGIAYLGSFGSFSNDNFYTMPVWVFALNIDNSIKCIAEAASHEVGHTLGLAHQGGVNGMEYYPGHVAVDGHGWAPIMGKSYSAGTTQWSDGKFNANRHQDDIATMKTYGIGLPASDVNVSKETAQTFEVDKLTNDKVYVKRTVGLIDSPQDIDYYTFYVEYASNKVKLLITNCVDLTLTCDEHSLSETNMNYGNLHINAALLNEQGEVVKQFNNPANMHVKIEENLSPGKYYIAVKSGESNPIMVEGRISSGYTNYGSIGQYIITGYYNAGVVVETPTPVIDLASTTVDNATIVQFSSERSSAGFSEIASYHWDFGDGQISSLPNPSIIYKNKGTYHVALTIENKDGLRETVYKDITVNLYKGINVIVSSIKISGVKRPDYTVTNIKAAVSLKASKGKVDTKSVVYGYFKGQVGEEIKEIYATSTYNAKSKTFELTPNTDFSKTYTVSFTLDKVVLGGSSNMKYMPIKNKITSSAKRF
jgi:PKD repeat protein